MSSSPPYFPFRYILGLAIAWFAVAASGQENVQPLLTLSDALQRAESSNPSLVAQRFGERAAEALIEQAHVRPSPTLDVTLENFAGTGTVGGIDRLESTVQANQTFERGGKREKRVALATRDHETAAQESAVRRAETRAHAATAYVTLVAAQERLALAAELLQLARQSLTLVNARVSAGAASSVEVARARAAVAIAQSDHNRAASMIISARAALAGTWGGAASDVLTVAGALQVPDETPVESSFRARLAVHPRLKMQSAIIAGRRAALTLEQARVAQDVTAGGGVRLLREGSDVALVAAVSVPFPTRQRNRGNIRAAREILNGAESSVKAIEAELNSNFAAAWQDLVVAHTAAQTLRRDALPPTEQAYSESSRAYESGELSLIEILESQRALIAIRREILGAEADYAGALVRLDALTDPTFSATARFLSIP